MVLLALDVGNTNLTVAVFEGSRLVADWRVLKPEIVNSGARIQQLEDARGKRVELDSGAR